MDIIEKIEETITPVVENEKMELVDIQYVTESGKKVLRVFLDKEGGVKLSDCERMSHLIGDLLDESDVLPSSYVLEISSPGLDRVLKKEKDFVKFAGRRVRVTIVTPLNGQRNFLGEILEAKDGKVTINDVTGKTVTLSIDNIAKARLEPEI